MPDMRQSSPGDAVRRWRAAGESGDAQGAAECLRIDVELTSPLTGRFRFQGREQVHLLLTAAFATISEIRFHTELGDGDTKALFYRGRVGEHEFEEAQLLRLDAEGLISELTLFGRPLPALTGLMSALGPELAQRAGHPALAAFIRASTTPLHAVTQLGDRKLAPLTDPNRG